jgi:hypothetical protein
LSPGERLVAHGKSVIARSREVVYRVARPTTGEAYCRTYDGPGRLLVTRVPYWQFRLLGPQPTTGSAAA